MGGLGEKEGRIRKAEQKDRRIAGGGKPSTHPPAHPPARTSMA